jgi:protein SCO1/2
MRELTFTGRSTVTLRSAWALAGAAWALAAALVLASPGGAAAGTPAAASAPLRVVNAWSRSTAPGTSVGVAYFEIVNSGAADTLQSIESPAAERVEIHSAKTVDGIMQMRELAAVDIPAAARVRFEPGGLHAMLMELRHPLKEGERVPLTLMFAHAGAVRAEALVQGLGAMSPPVSEVHDEPSGPYRLAAWPRHAAAPDFRLVDFDGRSRTLADYRGRVVVVFFGFVNCPDACPAELFKLALVMKRLGALRERVQVVFITLDPARDSGARLKTYVSAFDPRFVGLTGTAAQIDRAAARFSVEYAKVGTATDYSIDHSTITFVFDAEGKVRLLGALSTSVDDYTHDLAALAAAGGVRPRSLVGRADP